MDLFTLLLLLSSTILICSVFLPLRNRKFGKFPPGPYPFPIIGNILELGKTPHESLAKLAKTYGPLMYLRIGYLDTIVVSSPETAKDILQKYDIVFSSRTVAQSLSFVEHEKYSVGWLPVDNQWRKLRRICREHMFSMPRLDATWDLHREKLHKLCEYVNQRCVNGHSVNLGEAAFITSLNLMSATLFSVDFADFNSDSSQEFKDDVRSLMELAGCPNLADYFPVLKHVDPQGFSKRMKFYFDKMFAIFDGIIDQRRLEKRSDGCASVKNDLLEALLDLNQKHEELSRDDMNHLLMDLFVAGSDTTSATVEWAMTELLRNPKEMTKVKKELSEVIGANIPVQESDISGLPYLQAAVKETFRLHPAFPFLLPHKADADVEMRGYMVPKDAQILVNVWASGRDSNTWSNPELFMPERFFDSKIDYKGKDFELIPFGAGRRMCPGLPLAHRMVHLMLANLIHNFEWKLKDGKPEEMDISEKFGLSLQKAVPLEAYPIKV